VIQNMTARPCRQSCRDRHFTWVQERISVFRL
jgi:hypothetical protein